MTGYVRDRAVRRRDAAVRRLRRAKQALTAISILLAGVVGTAAARSFPGHSSHSATVAHTTDSRAPASAATGRSRRIHGSTVAVSRSHRHGRRHPVRRARSTAHHAAAQTGTTTSPAPAATTPVAAPSSSASVSSGGS